MMKPQVYAAQREACTPPLPTPNPKPTPKPQFGAAPARHAFIPWPACTTVLPPPNLVHMILLILIDSILILGLSSLL